MLSRENRIISGKDFQKVFQKGKRINLSDFSLHLLYNREGTTRVGIVVGKKYSKKATERNRAKRIFREAVRAIFSQLDPGIDMVILVRKGNGKNITLTEVQRQLTEGLSKRKP